MSKGAREIIDEYAKRTHDERFAEMAGTFLFAIEGVGSFVLKVNRGAVTLTPGATASDCTLEFDTEDDFVRMVSGAQELMPLVLQGRVRARGDIGLLMRLRRLILSSESKPTEKVGPGSRKAAA